MVKTQELLNDFRKNSKDFFEMFRTLLEGGRVFLWDPCFRINPELMLVVRLVKAEQLKLARPGDLVVSCEMQVPAGLVSAGVQILKFEDFSSHVWNQKMSQFSFPAEDLFLERPRTGKALFLDRDGVVIDAVQYISDAKDVRLKDGIVPLLKKAREQGYKIFLITNQSGLGRGMMDWKDFDSVQNEMLQQLVAQGIWVDDVECAPHFGDSEHLWAQLYPTKRKPDLQMLARLCHRHGIDANQSILIGDRFSDLEAGNRIGISKLYLIESVETEPETVRLPFTYQRIRTYNPDSIIGNT